MSNSKRLQGDPSVSKNEQFHYTTIDCQLKQHSKGALSNTCHLVIFDRHPEQRTSPWEKPLSREKRTTAEG